MSTRISAAIGRTLSPLIGAAKETTCAVATCAVTKAGSKATPTSARAIAATDGQLAARTDGRTTDTLMTATTATDAHMDAHMAAQMAAFAATDGRLAAKATEKDAAAAAAEAQ